MMRSPAMSLARQVSARPNYAHDDCGTRRKYESQHRRPVERGVDKNSRQNFGG